MSKDYSLLFHFENDRISVLEIKVKGIDSEDKSRIYHWLLFYKKEKSLHPLIFKEMGSMGEKEFRRFDDSRLEFDNQAAIFTKENKVYNLQRESVEVEPEQDLQNAIDEFINRL